MKRAKTLLPKEVAALVENVELNRAGWWDKTVQRLVLSAVWLRDHPPTPTEIHESLKKDFRLVLSEAKIASAIGVLEGQGLLVQLPGGAVRIPDQQRSIFEREIEAAEKVASDARFFFFSLVERLCRELDPKAVWEVFEQRFLTPLIKEVGANTYRLLAGQKLEVDRGLETEFLKSFKPEFHQKLRRLVTAFLDPKKAEVRAHVGRMLHATFCVEASGLPESVISKLNESIGKEIRFRVFVDTNFLFSLLELHENPSNAAARELQEVIPGLKSQPKVEFFITPRTIDEAKSSITAAKFQLSGVPAGTNFTAAALRVGVSGMAQKFLSERLRRGGTLSAADWFEPYLRDFVPLARGKGIELFNAKLDAYSTRQDVIDDIELVRKAQTRLPGNRRKSYEKIAHDMILWHFVKDQRPAYVESPVDARDWILTIDFRFIGFDEHKQKSSGSKVPMCLHPTSLIQLLQFWVPRTKEFEEAILGSLRLPFLFQELDVDDERMSLRILKGLGRFEGGDDIPEDVIAEVMLNEGLRSRLKADQSKQEEIELIRDALIAEILSRADSEAAKAKEWETALKIREQSFTELSAEAEAKESELRELRFFRQGIEENRKRNWALAGYSALLAIVVFLSIGAAWIVGRLLPSSQKIIGALPMKLLVVALTFIVAHLLLEWCVRRTRYIGKLWPFQQIRRFRGWLWTIIIIGFVGGIIGNLAANKIQSNLDQQQGSEVRPTPSAGR